MEFALLEAEMIRIDKDAAYKRNLRRYESDAARSRSRSVEDAMRPRTVLFREGSRLVAVPLIEDHKLQK